MDTAVKLTLHVKMRLKIAIDAQLGSSVLPAICHKQALQQDQSLVSTSRVKVQLTSLEQRSLEEKGIKYAMS